MSFTNLEYHVAFSTKDRRPQITPDILPRLVKYVGGIARNMDSELIGANGPEDHLHLALIVPAKLSITNGLRTVKANSSKWIHEEFPDTGTFAWQDGYAAFSVSHSLMPKVLRYIDGQQKHHKKMSFRDELIALLDKHGVGYDPKYILA